jgi:hypothetical protein
MDVCSQLYELADLTEPPAAERTKPPCCGEADGKPPVPDGELLADLVGRKYSEVLWQGRWCLLLQSWIVSVLRGR